MNHCQLFRWSSSLLLVALILAACGPATPLGTATLSPPEPTSLDAALITATLPAATPTVQPATDIPSPTRPPPTALPPATSEPDTAIPTEQATLAPTEQATLAPTETPQQATLAPTETRQLPTLAPTETREPATAVPTEPPPTPSPPPASPPKPEILSFTVVPTLTHNIGERMTFNWEATGDRAELCAVVGTGPTDCREVPIRGETAYVADEKSMAYLGFVLRVRLGGAETMSIVDVRMLCENRRPWFFDDPPLRCPADQPLESYAAAQSFERGFMVWIEATDEFYVFYEGPDERGFQVFHRTTGLDLKPGASQDNRVGEEPPPGLYEPVSGFGLVWRGEVEWPNLGDVRGRLGWATEPEFGFDTAYQCSTPSHPRSWTCFLRGPKGEVLVLSPDSTAQVRFLWEEW